MTAFESFSREALAAVQAASADSRDMRHFYLGVEHLVLGLFGIVDRDLQRVMQGAAFDVVEARGHIAAVLMPGEPNPAWGSDLRITPRLTAVVLSAQKLAEGDGPGHVRPRHLLQATLAEGRSVPVRALTAAMPDGLRRLTLELTAHADKVRSPERTTTRKGGSSGSETPILDSLGRDLTALAREGKLRLLTGRRTEALNVLQVLARQSKSNPLLVGQPGVGKTALVESIAQRAIGDDAPVPIRGKRIVEVSIGALVAGTQYRGDFEERVHRLLDECVKHPEVIVFFDEIHGLIGTGSGGGGLDAANILKPALGRGDFQCIGATTPDEFTRFIEKDAALSRRFEVVNVPEPSADETLAMLVGIREALEAHHTVIIEQDALDAAVRLSKRFMASRYFPDKAIDLLDRACAEARLASLSSGTGFGERRTITSENIGRIVSVLTGVPVGALTKEEAHVLRNLDNTLRQRVVGQGEAVSLVAAAVIAGRQLDRGRRPQAVFLFCGPTGVGKTELARALASALFGSESHLIRFDMSEYMERHTVTRLIGAPPSYVGHESEGELTGAVRHRPFAILLLDEIEKAHPDVMNLFLQVFEDGRLTDSHGRTVDFSNTIVLMTSNIGSSRDDHVGRVGFVGSDGPHGGRVSSTDRDAFERSLRDHFRIEFINRIDEVVVFKKLERVDLEKIIAILLQEVADQANDRGLTVDVTPAARELLIERGFSDALGARELRRQIDRGVRRPLAQYLLTQAPTSGTMVVVDRADHVLTFSSKAPADAGGPDAAI